MLTRQELDRAVRIQRKAYVLLSWFQDQLDDAAFPDHETHSVMGDVSIARQWIEKNLRVLPAEAAPASDELEPLAAMFASYLTTSFEANTYSTRSVATFGCYCPICVQIVAARMLKPKRVTSGDKAHAQRLKVAVLVDLAASADRVLSRDAAMEVLANPEVSERAALVAYARELLLRLGGDPGDPAILALWREFAWTKTGAPKKGFRLDVQEILDAQEALRTIEVNR